MINKFVPKSYVVIKEKDYNNLESLKYTMIKSPGFIKKWSNLAHILGFWHPRGFNTSVVGNQMTISKLENGSYVIQGKMDPSKEPQPYVKIILSNFNLEFSPETISTKEPIITELAPDIIGSSMFVNRSSKPASATKNFKFSITNTTSTYTSSSIANSVGVSAGFSFEFSGISVETQISYNFSQEYTLASQKDESTTSEIFDELTVEIPPKSQIPIKVIAFKNNAKIPYTALVKIKFDVTFEGFVIRQKTPYIGSLPYNYRDPEFSWLSYTFGKDNLSALEDLNTQYINRDLPNSTLWNWNLILSQKRAAPLIDNLLKQDAAQISGEFNKISSSNTVLETDEPIPIKPRKPV